MKTIQKTENFELLRYGKNWFIRETWGRGAFGDMKKIYAVREMLDPHNNRVVKRASASLYKFKNQELAEEAFFRAIMMF